MKQKRQTIPNKKHPAWALLDTCLRNTRCFDCEKPWPDIYMLTDEIWRLIAPEADLTHLCVFCAQKRLGRPLEIGDFTLAPCNHIFFVFWAMGARSVETSPIIKFPDPRVES